MHRTLLLTALLVLLTCIGVGAYVVSGRDAPVYFRMIEQPEDALDVGRVEWMRQKDRQKGVHLYSLEESDPYELLVYDNTYLGRNLYRTSQLRAALHDGVLRIDIREEDAVDDAYVNDRLLAYFLIKEMPTVIEVYRNDAKVPYEIERGQGKISR